MQRRIGWTFVATALLPIFTAGCGKKNAPPRALNLSMPSNSSQTASDSLAPEAVATGEQSPVKLALRIYRKNVKRTGSLWVQVVLTNIGNRPLVVTDDCFYEPTALDDVNPKSAHGTYVEIVDSRGKVVVASPPYGDAQAQMSTYDQMTPEQRKGADIVSARVRGWRAQGLTDDQIRLKVLDLSEEMSIQRRQDEVAARTVALRPGQSMATVAYAARFAVAPHAPLGSYAEVMLPYYLDLHPGQYRIRAVYDEVPSGCRWISGALQCERLRSGKPRPPAILRFERKHEKEVHYGQVHARTPYLDFEVGP